MRVNRITPLLMVDAIEPCLPFWVDRLGFSKTAEVPEGDRLGFVILARDGLEIMYQTHESVKQDVATIASAPMRGSFLFIVVDDIESIERALADVKPVVPRRTTFYGADEIIVREPAGNVVTFAQFAATADVADDG